MSNLIGQSLGRYHILEQLGEGGMAIVYKAYDTRLERDVAVKVIRTEKLTIETMGKTLKRFEREAKVLAKLTHPNIVPITDYGEHDEKPYLVMPYLPGGTLKQKLGKPIPWEDSVRLLIPIARALHYAHQQGIIHRDVKPSNILITQSGEPMLTDFGIAKILLDTEETADLTGTGMGVGTPEYMSPEQFQGKGVDARTDVYSLGVVLYEMVTGRKPYQADTPAAVLIKQVTEALPRPKSLVPELPDALEKVLLKALAKNKEDRFQDVAAFGNALENLLMGMGKEKQSVSTVRSSKVAKPDLDTQDTYTQGKTYSTKSQTAAYDETPRKTRTTQSTPSPVPPQQKKTVWWPWVILTLVILVSMGYILNSYKSETNKTIARFSVDATSTAEARLTEIAPSPTLQVFNSPTPSFTPTAGINGVLSDTPIDISTYSTTDITILLPDFPLGDQYFGSGVHFFIPKGENSFHTQNSKNQQYPTEYLIPVSYIAFPKKVFVLINAGYTATYYGKNIGYIALHFASGESLKYDLVLGENIREWSIGSGADGNLVVTTSSSDVQQIYLGTSSKNTTGVVDMLELNIPSDYSNTAIKSIEFKDSSQELWNSMNPGFFIIGITVRSIK